MARKGNRQLPAVKAQRGTVRPCRESGVQVLTTLAGLVQRPDGLNLAAQQMWDDYAPTAEAMGTLKPGDAMCFAHWCVMGAQIQASWQTTEVVPASFVAQWRMLGELFGLAGEKSRVVMKVIDAERPANIFSRNGKRR